MKPSVVLAVFVGHFSTSAYAWRLHESCQKPEYKDLVTKNVNSAFKMATGARNAIEAIDNGQSDANDDNVLKWMFLKKNEDTKGSKKLKEAGNIYECIEKNSKQHNDNCDDSIWDFVVYCDLERFKKTDNGKYEDEDTGAKISAADFEQSRDTCTRKRDFTLAFTEDQDDARVSPPSQLQICPWFLEWMKNQDGNTAPPTGHRASTLEKFVIPILKSKIGPLAEVDSRSLFDKVLLHEMTHTRGAGKCMDVDDDGGFFARWANVKYGWKRCHKLAEEGPTDHNRAPYRNADTLALAASSIRFNKQGHIVQEDGSIKDDDC